MRSLLPRFEGSAPSRMPRAILWFGIAAFAVAVLSIVDMSLPRPYDGVVLKTDSYGELEVQKVVRGSGAAEAGIRSGDRIVGIDRTILRSPTHAAEILGRRGIGDEVPYLVRRLGDLREFEIELGRRWIGSPTYLYACLLGFAFFFVGLFVLQRQPRLRTGQIFFVLASLFLLLLVCRLRPASYAWTDAFVLTTGTVALLFLPACFLHFFLVFPRRMFLRGRDDRRQAVAWIGLLSVVYALPPIVFAASYANHHFSDTTLTLVSGAPIPNWWLLAAYMTLGLTALAVNAARLPHARARRGALFVFFGALFGLLPFLTVAALFPTLMHDERYLLYAILPLALVPLTFTYAIVRFQLLDIRVILRKSLLYTATSAIVTALYAAGIALFNAITRGTPLADAAYFPILFALAIVFLFEPLRRRIQIWVDRVFHAERRRLQQAMSELGDAFAARVDLGTVVRDIVEKLPGLLNVHFAALYLFRGERLERAAGPDHLPEQLPVVPSLHEELGKRRGLTRSALIHATSPELGELMETLSTEGAEFLGDLSSPRRRIGLLLLSGSKTVMTFDREELELLDRLLQQAAIALETSLLLAERTQQAELEAELQLAAALQQSLQPESLGFGPGWQVAAICRPARHVGGDFVAELPGALEGTRAIAYGDVAGKSVSGALVMMAAHEILQSLAIADGDPERILTLANRRLYGLGQRRSFVALGYFAPNGSGLNYMLAGQPQPLVRSVDGSVRELPLPEHHLPLGALQTGSYRLAHVDLAPGEIVLGYSDGVVEATSPHGEIFGLERLEAVLASANPEPRFLVEEILRELESFTQGSDPYDDLTLVAVRGDREVSDA